VRLFVAVYPPPVVVDDLAKTLRTLAIGRAAADGVNVRLAAPERMHVTLAFLGEVPDTRLADVRTAIGAGVTAWAATWPRPTPPVLTVAGGGRFGRGRFTILWAGVRGDVAALHDLATAVRRQLRRARLPYDPKPLRPHLTVARPGDRLPAEVLAADRAALDGYSGPEFGVDEIRLVRSYPGPEPRYEHLARWPLRAA
jgi:2'-5' RNA ligase